MTAKPVPSRLEVYRALCALSHEAYGPLARMILSTASDEENGGYRSSIGGTRTATVRNIAKPVTTIRDDGDAA